MTSPTDLGSVITDPRIRRKIYAGYTIAALIAGAITVGAAVLGPLPAWATVMNAVIGFCALPVSGLAAANTSIARDDPPEEIG